MHGRRFGYTWGSDRLLLAEETGSHLARLVTSKAGLATLGEFEFGVAADGPHDARGGMAGSEEKVA